MRGILKTAVRTGVAMTALGLGMAVFAQSAFAGTGTLTATQTGTKDAAVQFNLNLPSGAACSGDNTAGYSVISYMVPKGTATSSFTFNNQTNFPDQGYGLIDSTGAFLATVPPALTSGFIPTSYASNLQLSQLQTSIGLAISGGVGTGVIASGSSEQWTLGVACIKAGVVTDNYSIDVTLATAAGGSGYTYNFASGVVPEAPWAVGLPIAGGAVVVGIFVVRRRRAMRRDVPVSA